MPDFDDVVRDDDLPPLAWSLSVGTGRLVAGRWVDVDGGTCFEGARSGDDDDAYRFGSGVVRQPDGYLCLPPSHTLDGLYLAVGHGGGVTVTNSLVWALRTAGVTAADRGIGRLPELVRTSTWGITGYSRLVLSGRRASVLQLLYSPALVGAGGFHESPVTFPQPRTFTFDEYRSELLAVIRGTLRYSPRYGRLLSTCSSGYDSVACTALGKEVGLETALTVSTGRGGTDDSGERPAREMGVPVRVYDRPGAGREHLGTAIKAWYLDLAALPEGSREDFDEFLATFANPGDVYFKPFEEHLPGAVLLTGFHGAIWDYTTGVGPWMRRGDTSGAGLNEFRLRVGFVHLPVPYVLARFAPGIERLSQSREMAPWRHGNPYNRPIPRRIAEEAGASRESFGILKKAANLMVVCGAPGMAAAYERVAARYP